MQTCTAHASEPCNSMFKKVHGDSDAVYFKAPQLAVTARLKCLRSTWLTVPVPSPYSFSARWLYPRSLPLQTRQKLGSVRFWRSHVNADT